MSCISAPRTGPLSAPLATSFPVIEWLFLAGLLALALASRFWGLGSWDYLGDEYYTITRFAERSQSLSNPAYYLLTKWSFQIFGENEWAARMPAALLGALAIPLFYLLWRNALGRMASATGALLILFSGWHLFHSQNARFYSGVFLFGSLTIYSLYRSLQSDSKAWMAATLLWAAIAAAFHLTAMLLGGICIAAAVGHLIMCPEDRRWTHTSVLYFGAAVVGAAIATPIILQVLARVAALNESWGYGPFNAALQLARYTEVPVAIASLFGALLLLLAPQRRHLGMVLTVAAGVPAVSVVLGSALAPVRPDYLFYAASAIFALAGYICGHAFRADRTTGLALALLLVASSAPGFVSHYTDRGSLDIRDAIGFLESNAAPEDHVLPFVSGLDHYGGERLRLDERIGVVNQRSAPWQQRMAAYRANLPGGVRSWIVIPTGRNELPPALEQWLRDNARLAWRNGSVRYDYSFRGLEIWSVEAARSG